MRVRSVNGTCPCLRLCTIRPSPFPSPAPERDLCLPPALLIQVIVVSGSASRAPRAWFTCSDSRQTQQATHPIYRRVFFKHHFYSTTLLTFIRPVAFYICSVIKTDTFTVLRIKYAYYSPGLIIQTTVIKPA